MGKAEQSGIYQTAAAQNATDSSGSQQGFNKAQGDIATEEGGINNYAGAVSQFNANNPYVQGGAAQTAANQAIADTAAGQAQAAGQVLQGQAVRTGQNAGGAIAATEKLEEQNARDLMGAQANATQQRLGAGANYTEAGLKGLQDIVGMQGAVTGQQGQLANQQGDLANQQMSEEEKAANTPTTGEVIEQGLNSAADNTLAIAGKAGVAAMCWIAAELWGGWADPRTVQVRRWLDTSFRARWYGPPVLTAYERWGEQVATVIGKRRLLRRLFQWLFDKALRQAVNDGGH